MAVSTAFQRRIDFRGRTPDDARLDAVVDEFYCVAD